MSPCVDPIVGKILAGWRYDISGIAPEMRSDYEDHLAGCVRCRSRQRLHRTIDISLIALASVSAGMFLLAFGVIRHFGPHHAFWLEIAALAGFALSALIWLIVAVATPAPMVMVRRRQDWREARTRPLAGRNSRALSGRIAAEDHRLVTPRDFENHAWLPETRCLVAAGQRGRFASGGTAAIAPILRVRRTRQNHARSFQQLCMLPGRARYRGVAGNFPPAGPGGPFHFKFRFSHFRCKFLWRSFRCDLATFCQPAVTHLPSHLIFLLLISRCARGGARVDEFVSKIIGRKCAKRCLISAGVLAAAVVGAGCQSELFANVIGHARNEPGVGALVSQRFRHFMAAGFCSGARVDDLARQLAVYGARQHFHRLQPARRAARRRQS